MCDPISATAAGMAVAGMGANFMQQRSIESDRSKVLRAESDRQDAYAKSATAYKDAAQAGMTREAQDAENADITAKRNDTIQGNISQEGAYDVPTAGSAPAVVKTQLAKKISEALATGRDRGQKLAKLGAWGDLDFNNRINLAESRGNINQQGDFATGSANVVPLELQSANNAGAGFGLAGNLLSTGGQFLAAYGGANPTSWDDVFSKKTPGPTYGPYGKAGLRPY